MTKANLKEKIEVSEKNCENAAISKDFRVCNNPVCILYRAKEADDYGFLCDNSGWNAAYKLYEDAKAQAKKIGIPIGTKQWYGFLRNYFGIKQISESEINPSRNIKPLDPFMQCIESQGYEAGLQTSRMLQWMNSVNASYLNGLDASEKNSVIDLWNKNIDMFPEMTKDWNHITIDDKFKEVN